MLMKTPMPRLICRLAAVHLVDAHLAADPAKYMAALLASLSAMLHLQLPHVNVLSKVLPSLTPLLARRTKGANLAISRQTAVQS